MRVHTAVRPAKAYSIGFWLVLHSDHTVRLDLSFLRWRLWINSDDYDYPD